MLILAPTLTFAPPPRMADWPSFLLLGVLAAAGMYLVARAYAKAEAQQLAPIHYSELLYAAAFGYFLFQERPRPQVLIGACVIVVACLWAAYDERRLTLRAGAAE